MCISPKWKNYFRGWLVAICFLLYSSFLPLFTINWRTKDWGESQRWCHSVSHYVINHLKFSGLQQQCIILLILSSHEQLLCSLWYGWSLSGGLINWEFGLPPGACHHWTVQPKLLFSRAPCFQDGKFPEDRLHYTSTHQPSTWVMFANELLATASHMAELRVDLQITSLLI